MTFELQHTDSASDARAGIITTDHGQILTPIFMPVGTTPIICISDQDSIFSEKQEDCISSTLGIVLSSLTVAVFRYSL